MTGAGRVAGLAAAALALALGAVATAQGFRQAPTPPAASPSAPSPSFPTTAPPSAAAATSAASTGPAASGRPGPDATLAPGANPAGSRATAGGDPAIVARLGLADLQGGGDPAPVCRSACAGTLYRCIDGGGDDTCQGTARTCREACDTTSQAAGRLVSPLPQAGLAAAGPLRALPGSLSAPAARQ